MRQSNNGGNEVGGDSVGETLHRGAAALGFADQLHDLREHRFAADAFGFHDETAAGIQRAAGDFIAGGFFDGHRFASDHGFIHGASAFADCAVNGDALAGAYAQAVAAFHLIERDIFF